jgi:hypothetical protein
MAWLYVFLCTISGGLASLHSFLQQSSSLGQVASGLEKFEADFSTFSYKIDKSLLDIKAQIISLNQVDTLTGLTLIAGKVTQLKNELKEISSLVQDINRIITQNDECSILSTCNKCARNPDCVWCVDNGKCVKGDEDGPFYSPCQQFSYMACPYGLCDGFFSCSVCISDQNCAWCDLGQLCIQSQSEINDNCPSPFYYYAGAPGRNQCPSASFSESETERTIDENSKTTYQGLYRDILRLKNKYDEVIGLIKELLKAKDEIQASMRISNEIEIVTVGFKSTIVGLTGQVDELAEQEIEAERQRERERKAKFEEEVIEESTKIIEEDEAVVVSYVNEQEAEIRTETMNIDKNMDIAIDTIEANIGKINNALDIPTVKEETEASDEVSIFT